MRKMNLKRRILTGVAALSLVTGAGVAADLSQAEPAQAYTYTNCYSYWTIHPGGSYAWSLMRACTKDYNRIEEGHPWFYRDHLVTWKNTTMYA